MPLPRLASTVELKRCHLFLPEEKDEFRDYPNFDSPLASINLPRSMFWTRALFGTYDELYIISPETSPEGSVASSDESRKISRSSTFTSLDADTGAEKDD